MTLQAGARIRGNILARQTVKQHLNRLMLAGIVIARKAPRRNGETTEYVLDPDSLAVMSTAFQELARSFAKPVPAPLFRIAGAVA